MPTRSPNNLTMPATKRRSSRARRRAHPARPCRSASRVTPRLPTSSSIPAVDGTRRKAYRTGRSRRTMARSGLRLARSKAQISLEERSSTMISAVKVDRVHTPGEAETLEALGVTLIGISLQPDPRFHDQRTISVADASSIKRILRHAKLVGALELTGSPEQVLE